MPVFRLTPVPARLSDPLWQASQAPHEECYAAAETEQKARAAAARHFRMDSAISATGKIVNSPWQTSELTKCAGVAEAIGNMPIGLVYRASNFPYARHIPQK
jgi:hypothetical protein